MKPIRAWSAGLFGAASLTLSLLCAPALAADICTFPAPPRVISTEGAKNAKGARVVQVWDVPDAVVYWSTAEPTDPAYGDFVSGVAKHVPVTDPVALLRASPGFDIPRLKQNNLLVAERARDWIHPSGCLEKLLMSVQHDRVNTFDRPTEFAALVLRSSDGERLRIYYLTVNEDWIGSMSPLTEPAIADTKAGWRLEIAMHNHSFHPGQPSLDGLLAPSEADAQFAVNLAASASLKAAWITNGLHTSRIPAQAFDQFLSPPATRGDDGRPAVRDGSKAIVGPGAASRPASPIPICGEHPIPRTCGSSGPPAALMLHLPPAAA